MKFDDLLLRIGSFGPYQKRLYVLLCLPAVVCALQVMQTLIFFFEVPKHRCALPGLDNDTYTIQSEQHQQLVNITIPLVTDHYGNQKYSSCQLYSIVNTSNVWRPGVDNETVTCHRWVYDTSVYTSTIAQTLDLVCERRSYVSHVKMLAMVGMLVGGIINGPLPDRFGRRPIIVGNVFIMVLSSIALVWAPNAAVVFLLVFIYQICGNGQYMVCFVFGMEIVAPSKRMWTGVSMNLFWSAGNLLTALTTYIIRDWKIRQLVISVPTIVFAYLFFIPESPRWLLEHGRTEEAKKVVMKMCKTNGVDISPDLLDQVSEDKQEKHQEQFWALFRSRVLLRRLFIIFYIWFAVGMGFYGLSMNVGNLSGDIYLNFTLFVIFEILAYIACYFLIDRIGRKRLLCVTMLATASACVLPLVPVLISEQPNIWAINTFAITGYTCASAAMATVFALTTELMPTSTRNSGLAFSTVCSRLGSIIAPYVVDLTLHVRGRFGQVLPMLVFGAITAIAAIMALLLPETRNRKLPETVEDAVNFEEEATKVSYRDPVEKISLTLQNSTI